MLKKRVRGEDSFDGMVPSQQRLGTHHHAMRAQVDDGLEQQLKLVLLDRHVQIGL